MTMDTTARPSGLTSASIDIACSKAPRAPSGFAFEYGFGGIEIDDHRWEVEHWTSGSFWGHRLDG